MNSDLISAVKAIARQASDTILEVYEQQNLGIETKSDSTPVTIADVRANTVIEAGLKNLEEQYPILSEESGHAPLAVRQQWQRYWLVDPLDGTQNFINRDGQFTVNIALMEKAEDGLFYPLLGVVHVPVENTVYWGGHKSGAFRQAGDQPAQPIQPRKLNQEDVVVLGSRNYGTSRAANFVGRLRTIYPRLDLRKVGSALKSCYIAEGSADIYPRLGTLSEWDTGAVQAVVEGAGGLFLNPQGERLAYNFREHLNITDFLVLGDQTVNWRVFWNQAMLAGL